MQPPEFQEQWINRLTLEQLQTLRYSWEFWGRPEQRLPPGDWFIWLLLAGRGFGKTRTLAESVLEWHREGYRYINLAGRTSGDLRKTVIDGESGIIAKAPPEIRPRYIASLRELHWPNGNVSLCFTADEPDQGRGPQSEKLAIDELGAWEHDGLWHNLLMGLRIGDRPQAVVATTGRRKKLLKDLLRDPAVHITRGHTLDNRANLSTRYIKHMLDTYDGTELGRQELEGDCLLDHAGPYWTEEVIEANRRSVAPALRRVVVGVDPAVTNNRRSDVIGIVVVGICYGGDLWVLGDYSLKGSPNDWGEAVMRAYQDFGASLIVAETNRGGDLVESNLRAVADRRRLEINITTINSQEDKSDRAEPVSTKYVKGRVHHVGKLAALEEEQCEWDPTEVRWSPNRIDALVFACSELAPNAAPANPRGVIVRNESPFSPLRRRNR